MRRLSKLCVVFSLLNWLAAFTLPSEQKKNTNFVFLANQTSNFLRYRLLSDTLTISFAKLFSYDVVVLDFISRRDAEAQRLKPQKFFRVISYHFVVPNIPPKTSVPLFLHFLRVSPTATATAFKSFHLLLTLNTEYGGQRRTMQAIIQHP